MQHWLSEKTVSILHSELLWQNMHELTRVLSGMWNSTYLLPYCSVLYEAISAFCGFERNRFSLYRASKRQTVLEVEFQWERSWPLNRVDVNFTDQSRWRCLSLVLTPLLAVLTSTRPTSGYSVASPVSLVCFLAYEYHRSLRHDSAMCVGKHTYNHLEIMVPFVNLVQIIRSKLKRHQAVLYWICSWDSAGFLLSIKIICKILHLYWVSLWFTWLLKQVGLTLCHAMLWN